MSASVQSLVKSTRSLVEVASKQVNSKAMQSYGKIMENNAKYVLQDKSQLADMPKQYIFTHLAELPGYLSKASTEFNAVKGKMSGWRELSAKEAGTALVFSGELFAWFCVGEYVGRGFSLTGYSV